MSFFYNKFLSKISFISLLVLLIIYFYLNLSTLISNPNIWSDEAVFADVASNIENSFQFKTDIWGDLYYGIRDHFYLYPPFYLLNLALIFKIFSLSIFNQRLLSVVYGGLFLISFYYFSKPFFYNSNSLFKKIFPLITLILIITDNIFLRGSKIGRPEIVVLFLTSISFSILFSLLNKKIARSNIFYILIGIITSFALLSHLLAFYFFVVIILVLIYKYGKEILKKKQLYILIISYLTPLIFWLISIFPNYYILLKQISLARNLRRFLQSHIESVYHFGTIEEKIVYSIYLALILVFILFAISKRSVENFFLAILLVFSFLVCLFGKLEWYSIYFIPYLYLSTVVIISTISSTKKSKTLSLILSITLIILLFINIQDYYKHYTNSKSQMNNYYNITKEIEKIIPEDKTVYISTIPDLYYFFKNRNLIYELPPAYPNHLDEYVKNLDRTDYIVINFHIEAMFVGGLLSRYIDINNIYRQNVGNSNIYAVEIIKLRSQNDRFKP